MLLQTLRFTVQNSTINATDTQDVQDYFALCSGMYEGVMLWASLSVFFALFGFPASIIDLWELFKKHKRGTPTTPNDVFMLNLTVMDFIFLGFVLPRVCNYVAWKNSTLENFGIFLYTLTFSGRPLFMTCICLDCYLAVVHPITYRARKGLTSRVLVSMGVWAVTLTYGTMFSLTPKDFWKFSTVLPTIMTVTTVGFCDFFIFRALKSSDPAGRDLHPQKKKALQIIINSLVMAFVAYLPLILIFFLLFSLQNIAPLQFLYCRIAIPVMSLPTIGSAIMPILHLSNLGKLDFLNLWCRKTG